MKNINLDIFITLGMVLIWGLVIFLPGQKPKKCEYLANVIEIGCATYSPIKKSASK